VVTEWQPRERSVHLAEPLKARIGHSSAKGILPRIGAKANNQEATKIYDMPALKNPRHEKLAQLVASGMTAQAAFCKPGITPRKNAPRLRNNALVAKRIEELQARNERKAEMAALTRDELIGILTDIVHATRARLSEARPAEGVKAAEMLAKCGWNEPERVDVQSVEVKVDAALIEQLRAGARESGKDALEGAH
jgi:hypothetical protein